ncbi:hypothetical protein ACYSNW_14625 [Enterococcus sp. LJL99]
MGIIYTFKRITGLLSLMFVEIFLAIFFLLTYKKILWVSWDSSLSIYFLIAIGLIFLVTLYIFLKTRQKLSKIIASTIVVEAKLINKKQFSYSNRKLIIWKYEYLVNNEKVHSKYWSVVMLRDLEIGDSFRLAIDPENQKCSYFPLLIKNAEINQ